MPQHQLPRTERVDRPAADRDEHHHVADERGAAGRAVPDHQVDAGHRQRRADQWQPADALLPSTALISAMTTGVAASISELLATLVRARPPMKKY